MFVVVVAAGLVGFQCFELSSVSSPSLVTVEPSTTGERAWYNWRNEVFWRNEVEVFCRGLFLVVFEWVVEFGWFGDDLLVITWLWKCM